MKIETAIKRLEKVTGVYPQFRTFYACCPIREPKVHTLVIKRAGPNGEQAAFSCDHHSPAQVEAALQSKRNSL